MAKLVSAVSEAPGAEISGIAAAAAMHEMPWVRQALMGALVQRAPQNADVRDAVTWLTHDYEDFVAFDALALAGRLRLTEALPELFLIVGRASRRLSHEAGKPVGIGHAVALRAISAIVGSSDPSTLVTVEGELFPDGYDASTYPALEPREARTAGTHGHHDMVRIPGGSVVGGPPSSFDARELVFDWDDPVGPRSCEGFMIDVLPVSNAEYDAFAASPEADRHVYCHPAEQPNKIHLRNTLLDTRTGPDHPVTGVDWFDAYAYARSRGKRLPNETEWQFAAQGGDGRAYPWGDTFESDRTHGALFRPGPGWSGVEAWRRHLLELVDTQVPVTTVARGIPGGDSPFGVRDMSGNVWEWTASSSDGPAFSPVDGGRDAIDVIYDQRSYAVIKGGTWTSLPEQLSVAFRGRDLALDRHFEIGFRCACDCF
ncbi:formylglycine-generating enzyme family protein [Kitasatospora sp. NPDC101183]|uniref:formylglycine-generating enzyme family protein n=1 Tax=Kitasatospora sp. NPDC101183 TaxID=3364100 RepID=UPI0037F37281